MKIVDLVSQIPTDTQERVRKASKRFGPYIRQAIRAEIRLQLNPRHNNEDFRHFKSEVPTVVDRIGYPKSIEQKTIPENNELPALLSLWKPWLVMLRDSSKSLGNALDSGPLYTIYDLLPDARPLVPGLRDTYHLAEILLKQINKYDLVKDILDVNEDILGQYVYQWNGFSRSSGHVSDEAYKRLSSKVVVYWGVIGLIAMALGVNVEDLTVVVLAHEIAHAYTHLGFDIDQYRWGAENFNESAHEVKEG